MDIYANFWGSTIGNWNFHTVSHHSENTIQNTVTTRIRIHKTPTFFHVKCNRVLNPLYALLMIFRKSCIVTLKMSKQYNYSRHQMIYILKASLLSQKLVFPIRMIRILPCWNQIWMGIFQKTIYFFHHYINK